MMLFWGLGIMLPLVLVALLPIVLALIVMRTKGAEPRDARGTHDRPTDR
ncbi:MAG: hypothetical protein ACP5SI_11295 [Chloroflexia bacterium]